MSKKGYLIGAIIVIVVVFFILFSGGSDVPEVVIKSFKANLSPISESNISGTATVTDMEGKAKVVINLVGASEGSELPVHFHLGTCAELGEVKFPLNPIQNGISETILEISTEELNSNLPLALNVHESVNKMDVNVSCGDLTLDTAEDNGASGTVEEGSGEEVTDPAVE